jgi:predicted aconitase
METDGLETVEVTRSDIEDVYSTLNCDKEEDIAIFGCPHASLEEIAMLASEVEGKTLKKPVWICTSRMMKEAANRMGFTEIIENAGGLVVADTCMVVSPIEDMGYSITAVNSGKAANYLPGFCKQEVVFNNIKSLIKEK